MQRWSPAPVAMVLRAVLAPFSSLISDSADVAAASRDDNVGVAQESMMRVRVAPSHRHRFSRPDEPARRLAVWSLLMIAATAVAGLIAGAAGTFLQFVVFDLEEQQLLSEAGAWGYVTAFFLVALMVIPASVGVVLGLRARRLGERRLGTTGIVANALVASYLVVTAIAFLVG
jgi:sterol desaturase/sphingolipid hydroxylase (fatty acid hydroxylase superfamily)